MLLVLVILSLLKTPYHCIPFRQVHCTYRLLYAYIHTYIHTYMYVPACPNVRPSFYDAGPLGCIALCILGQVKLSS